MPDPRKHKTALTVTCISLAAGVFLVIAIWALRRPEKSAPSAQKILHPSAFSPHTHPLQNAALIVSTIAQDALSPRRAAPDELGLSGSLVRDRFVGSLIGLALSDAYGSAYEFMTPESVAESGLADDHEHPGYFSGRLGAWTDDTSMALCLLASALEKKKFDPADVFEKYQRWYKDRYMNFDAQRTDFGITTRVAISQEFVDNRDQPSWGNGVIMRLAPIVMTYILSEDEVALRIAAASGGMTAGDKGAVDFPAFMAYIMRGFIKGTLTKEQVCARDFPGARLRWYWEKYPYGENFAKFVSSYPNALRPKTASEESSSHLCLSRAIHVFCTEPSFPRALKKIVGYGHDTDTSAAIFGQLYGAYYGLENLKRLDWPKAKGLQNEKLYKSTDRIDAIRDLCKELWNHLTLTESNRHCKLVRPDGRVQDINPCYKLPPPYKNIDGVSCVEIE